MQARSFVWPIADIGFPAKVPGIDFDCQSLGCLRSRSEFLLLVRAATIPVGILIAVRIRVVTVELGPGRRVVWTGRIRILWISVTRGIRILWVSGIVISLPCTARQ